MFKIINVKNESLRIAIVNANSKIYWDCLYEEILLKESFDMSTLPPIMVYEDIRAFWEENDINVKVYYPKWRWSKALGYFSPARPNDININGYKLNRTVSSFVATLFHELVHMADNANKIHSYGHGGNDPSGKQNTSPYWIGNVFNNFNDTEMKTYRSVKPWYKRLWHWLF
jgi:hypothetical protein